MEIKKLVIDRAKWGKEQLRWNDGYMCCLGHLGATCGIPLVAMLWKGMPSEIEDEEVYNRYPEFVVKDYGKFCDLAAGLNDNPDMSRKEKEGRLKTLFKSRGVTLTFKGRSTKP